MAWGLESPVVGYARELFQRVGLDFAWWFTHPDPALGRAPATIAIADPDAFQSRAEALHEAESNFRMGPSL